MEPAPASVAPLVVQLGPPVTPETPDVLHGEDPEGRRWVLVRGPAGPAAASWGARVRAWAPLRHRHLQPLAGFGPAADHTWAWFEAPTGGPVPLLPQPLAAQVAEEVVEAMTYAASEGVVPPTPNAATVWLTSDGVTRLIGPAGGEDEEAASRGFAAWYAAWTGVERPDTLPLAAWSDALREEAGRPSEALGLLAPTASMPRCEGPILRLRAAQTTESGRRLPSQPPERLLAAEAAGASHTWIQDDASSEQALTPVRPRATPAAQAVSALPIGEPSVVAAPIVDLPAEPSLGRVVIASDDDAPPVRPRGRGAWWIVLVAVGCLGAVGIAGVLLSLGVDPAPIAPAAIDPKPEPPAAETGAPVVPVDPTAPAPPPPPPADPGTEDVPAPPSAPKSCVSVQLPATLAPGADAVVSAGLCPDAGPPVTLFFRAAGTDAWASTAMSALDGRWAAAVPIDEARAAGLELYVVASGGNTAGTSLRPLRAP